MTSASDDTRSGVLPARGLASAIDYAVGSHRRAVVVMLVLCALAFLPGFFQLPAVDRDEARFAQATKQMIERGDYVDIRFQDEVRYKKPVGIYWLQAVAVKTGEALSIPSARTTIWLYRLPSLAGATGAVLLTYWTALAFVTRRAALLAALMMASSILLGVEARLAKTDAALLLTSIAAMGAMARVYLAKQRMPDQDVGWTWPAIFWTALAAGFLIKGPLVVMFVALTAIVLAIADRSARWLIALKPLPGIGWTLLLVLPWFVAIVLKSGDSFFAKSVGDDMWSKVLSSQESHGAPPGFYALLFWITFWPGSVLAGLAAPAIWRARRETGARFLLAWLVPSWIVFELVMTKLPHYVLPLYPAIAILIAGLIEPDALAKMRWMLRGTVGWFLFPAVVAIAVPVIFIVMARDPGIVAWPFAAVAAIFGLFAWWLYEADGPERALMRGMASSVFIGITVYAVTFPSLPSLFPSAMIGDAVKGAGCDAPHLASTYAYQEPSLVFIAGTDTRFTDGAGAAEFLRSGSCHFALVDWRSERSFVQRADAIGLRYSLVQRIEGFNVSVGKQVALTLFRSTP